MSTSISNSVHNITEFLDRYLVGKRDTTRLAVMTLLCGGHLLIEDVPGVGKTTLARAIARALGGQFKRIQFTPDLLPSDVTGTSIFNPTTREFEFQEGPIFGNVVLADEINRATPKTQSALLEAMEEHQVTSDGVVRTLPSPFFVLATQNNIEMMGTFPLPEAQLDRFFARISIGYPDRDAEIRMTTSTQANLPLDQATPVSSMQEILALQKLVREVTVDPKVREYIVDIVRATREHIHAALGASPRGTLHLLHASQSHAAMEGREFVVPDDVKAVAVSVLSHRLMVRGGARDGGEDNIVRGILERIPAPVPSR